VSEATSKTLIEQYEAEVEAVIGFVVARMMLGPPYRLTGPRYPGCPPFFVIAEGQEPGPTIMLRSSATATVRRSTWQEIENRLREKGFGLNEAATFDTYKAIGKIGQWHLTALNEKDQFRRFMWSYIGLEIIVDAVSRIGRTDLTEMLASTSMLGSTTIVELLWPQDVRDTDPNRSLRFKFALCAAVLSSETASEDVVVSRTVPHSSSPAVSAEGS
jgi:hypothetical protein